ncbi:unnamed protein product [Urochloa humidicola]
MANFAPPFPLDRESRRRGEDPQEMEALFGRVLTYIYHALPEPPVYTFGDLCILFDDDGGGVDRLSLLPDMLLGNIVSRLEILSFEGLFLPLRLRLVSNSLRCLQVQGCQLDNITVVDAPRLERLFLHTYESEGSKNRIKITHAPVLRLFGNFELGKHELQIGNTIIKARTAANPNATIPSVMTLDVDVRFGFRNDAKMLPIFLGCFPNVQRLHIHSKNTAESTGRLNIKFWQESDAIKSALSGINLMAFYDFRFKYNQSIDVRALMQAGLINLTMHYGDNDGLHYMVWILDNLHILY